MLLTLPTGGCCTLARWFCGPDTSPWVSVSYDTPAATLQTFLEAIRRANPDQIYLCFGQRFKEQRGIDNLVSNMAWERLQREVPGLHLAGYAKVPDAPQRQQDRGVSYELDLDGRILRIDLVRQAYWRVRYQKPDGREGEDGRNLAHDSLNGFARIEAAGLDPLDGEPQSRILLDPLTVVHPSADQLELEQVQEVTLAREWKIDAIEMQ